MAKFGGGKDPASELKSEPKSFPQTAPPVSGDISTWVLNAITKMEGTLGRVEATQANLQVQVDRIEGKVDAIKTNVDGHGTWIHTLKYVLSGLGILLAFLITWVVGPWLKSKTLGP